MSNNVARSTIQKNQAGMVSIMVTMILMIVMSLIVIGFAQISRRNQREVLDRQLSTQAFYAAESGVNDVRNLIATIGPPPSKTDCANSGAYYSNLTPNLDTNNNVSYSCVLVNPTPPDIDYTNVSTNSVVTPVQSASPANPIDKLTITWFPNPSAPSPLTGCPASPNNAFLPTNGVNGWKCGYGVMRLDLVPTDSAALTAGSLAANTMTTFGVPEVGALGSAIPFAANNSNTNDLTGIACTSTECQLTITGMAGHSSYYLRLSSLYVGVPVKINGVDAANQPVDFQNGQVVIDSTGKAQDVLRRIQVHISLAPNQSPTPNDAISSASPLCKRFSATSGYIARDPSIPGSIASDSNADRLCTF